MMEKFTEPARGNGKDSRYRRKLNGLQACQRRRKPRVACGPNRVLPVRRPVYVTHTRPLCCMCFCVVQISSMCGLCKDCMGRVTRRGFFGGEGLP